MDGNAVFTLTGNKDGGCFSPFALVWEESTVTPPAEKITVTFRVVNGTWSDGTSGNITHTIDKGTTLAANGISIPAGMRPNSGYEGGSWNVEPDPAAALTGDITYTYSFRRESTGGGTGGEYGHQPSPPRLWRDHADHRREGTAVQKRRRAGQRRRETEKLDDILRAAVALHHLLENLSV